MAPFSNRLIFCALMLYVGFSVVSADDDTNLVSVEVENESIEYESPKVDPESVYLAEHFDNPKDFQRHWVKSNAKKDGVDEDLAKYDGVWEIQAPERELLKNDMGLVLTSVAKHSAIATPLKRPFVFNDKPLVVQYEVILQSGLNCGGAYIKLLSKGTSTKSELSGFNDQTPYTIMFGPDKCGNDNKLHFIFRHKNPITGEYEEKHSDKTKISGSRLEEIYKDKEPHLYTLIVRPDNTFTIKIDHVAVRDGSLLQDMTPSVNPPEEIPDPKDVKPDDWEDKEKIVDPLATKPDDWDEEAPARIMDPNSVKPAGWLDDEPNIPDPTAEKPDDWDDDMDGEWEAPLIDNPACADAPGCGPWAPAMIPNPEYKGVWRAPLIPNPNYKGPWVPRKIPNPNYFKDDHPFKMTPISAIGFELWTMSSMLYFDNIIITDDLNVAEAWAKQTFDLKRAQLARNSASLWGRMMKSMNYKPGWWAIYFIYCAIPITIYVWYLLRRLNEETAWDRGLRYASDNPWVYVIVAAVVVFLLYLIISFIRSKPTEEDDAKKTDAVVEDDPHESSADEEAEDEVEAQEEAARPTKQQLETKETDEKVETPTDEGAGDGQRKRKPRKE